MIDLLLTVLAYIFSIALVTWIVSLPFRLLWNPLGDLVGTITAITTTVYFLVKAIV